MTVLTTGANAPLPSNAITLHVRWSAGGAAPDIDVSAFVLTANGRVRGDDDMIFFNQPTLKGGGVSMAAGAETVFSIDTSKLPSGVAKIAIAATMADGGQSFSALTGGVVEIRDEAGASAITYNVDVNGRSEVALILGEVYERNGAWKFRAVGQGFNGGLKPLAEHFGVVVDDAPAPAPEPAPAAQPAPAPPSSPGSVKLSKVSLKKQGEKVSLKKGGAAGFEQITINLNWSQNSGKRGFFGRNKGVDLDLGCLIAMKNGQRGVVQALGRMFGSFVEPPYIELSGDDRTGAVVAGETLRINGRFWKELDRVALFAFIYEGAARWSEIDGVVTISVPGQPEVEIRLDNHDPLNFCGIMLLENVNDNIEVTRLVQYFRDHKYYDEYLGWGLNWTTGSK